MTTEVAPAAIAHSGELFSAARDHAFKAADRAIAVMQGLAGMGGTDRSGHKWRTDYDNYVGGESPGQGLTSSMQASINSVGRVAQLLHATAVNHDNANTQSQIGQKPPPQTPPAAASDVCLATLPSAEGNAEGEPAWWSTIVSYLQGWTWPNGHQGQLRSASDAWREAGRGFRDAKRGLEGDAHSLGAIAPLMDQRSPEMNAVVATCNKAANSLSTVADGCDAAADMCAAYAKAIDEVHSKIEHEMVVLGATVAVTEAIAAILVPLTVGASEAVSKGIDVARITATAQRIIEILRAFAAAAEASSLPAVAGAANAARFLGPELAEILSARATIFGIEGVGAGGRAAAETTAAQSASDFAVQFATKPNTAFFWSGRTSAGVGVGPVEGASEFGLAGETAAQRGGVTLEQVMKQRGIKLPEWNASDPVAVKAWEDASAAYANGVSGEVRAVLGTSQRPGSIWETVELPRLKNNPNVTKITAIDPETGAERVIFTR